LRFAIFITRPLKRELLRCKISDFGLPFGWIGRFQIGNRQYKNLTIGETS